MEFIEELQITIQNCIKAMGLLDAGYATVLSTSPLTLRIQNTGFEVVEPVAEMSSNVRYKSVTIQGEKVILNPGLANGDKVIVLKVDAGQKYLVIAKV